MDNNDTLEGIVDGYGMYIVGWIFFGLFYLLFIISKFILVSAYRILKWIIFKIRDFILNGVVIQE